jgi:hypothetical protein
MLKLTVAVVAVALAGTASAAGWRSLRIDASSEASFSESVAAFQEKLSPVRRYVFASALQDIWLQGTTEASAAAREFTAADYFAQLDGLGYDEVVTLTDPTGDTAARRYRQGRDVAYTALSKPQPAFGSAGWQTLPGPPPVENGTYRGATRAIDGGVRGN